MDFKKRKMERWIPEIRRLLKSNKSEEDRKENGYGESIADETEKGAKSYEKYIPGFKGSFGKIREAIVPPVELVPEEMFETRVFDVWKGWMYCIEFIKP